MSDNQTFRMVVNREKRRRYFSYGLAKVRPLSAGKTSLAIGTFNRQQSRFLRSSDPSAETASDMPAGSRALVVLVPLLCRCQGYFAPG